MKGSEMFFIHSNYHICCAKSPHMMESTEITSDMIWICQLGQPGQAQVKCDCSLNIVELRDGLFIRRLRGFQVLLSHKICSLHRHSPETDAHISGFGCFLRKQNVCCWHISYADKPEANTAIIRHLMRHWKKRRLLCPLSLPFSLISRCTLSGALSEGEDPNQQTGVVQAVKTSLWRTISIRRPPSSSVATPSFGAALPDKQAYFSQTLCSHQLSSTLHVTNTAPVNAAMLTVIYLWRAAQGLLSCGCAVWQCSLSPSLGDIFKLLS